MKIQMIGWGMEEVRFEQIELGECFRYNGEIYIKQHTTQYSGRIVNAWSPSFLAYNYLADDTLVNPMNCELVEITK